MPDDLSCMIAIISFDQNLKKGKYTVIITTDGEKKEVNDRSVLLEDRVFRRDNITLNENLSDLRADSSERRKKETSQLVNLFNMFNRNSIHDVSRLNVPLEENPLITSFYGDIRIFTYRNGETAHSFHNGIDLAAGEGTKVFSSAAGRVVFAGDRLITGKSIIIEHLPGLYSIYYHLSEIHVNEKINITKGSLIGLVGSTGLSTGPHLHWEVRNQMMPVDPEFLVENPLIDKDEIMSIINSDFSDIARGR